MRGTVTETIDQVEMKGPSAKIDHHEKIDPHEKIDHVVKTEVAVSNAVNAVVVNVKIVEKEGDGKTVLVTMTVEVVITVVTNMEITTGIVLNVRIPTSPSEQNVIAVVSLKAREEAEGAAIIAEIIPVVVKAVVVIIVATSTEITTGIALNVRIPTSPSAQNAIAVANRRVKEEAEIVVMVDEIIHVAVMTEAVMTEAVMTEAVIVEINTVTMIGIAPSVKTRISVSVLNVIAVANPKAKVARIATTVLKVIAEEEREPHAVILGR